MLANSVSSLRGWRLAVILVLPLIWTVQILRQQGYDGGAIFSPKPSKTHERPSDADGSWRSPYGDKQQPANGASQKHSDGFQYSIKPLAYVFPQFHAIPENDEFWGVNFTEWTNVKKVTHNAYGQETLRPTEEVGYYNLLDRSTRARQAQLLRDTGFYGIVFHHYWFGRPVMDKVLLSLLHDGEPDLPFMLNWANEA